MKKKTTVILAAALSILVLVVVIGFAYSVKWYFSDWGEQQDLMAHNWVKMEFSENNVTLPEKYSDASELYLFAPRDLIEKKYDFSKCKLGEKSFSPVDSSFNLTSSDFKALFLVAKINNDKKFTEITCPDLPSGTKLAIGYMP